MRQVYEYVRFWIVAGVLCLLLFAGFVFTNQMSAVREIQRRAPTLPATQQSMEELRKEYEQWEKIRKGLE